MRLSALTKRDKTLVMALGFVLTGLFSRQLTKPASDTHIQNAVILVTELISGAAAVLFFLRKVRKNRFLLALPRVRVGNLVAILVGLFVVTLNSTQLGFAHHTVADIFLAALLSSAIGVTEEFIFRGVFFIRALRKGRWYAAWSSSLAFGIVHSLNFFAGQGALTTLAQVISATGMGFLLLGLMLYTRSIWTAVVIHALFDFAPILKGARIIQESYTGHKELIVALGTCVLALVGLMMIYLSTRVSNPQKSTSTKLPLATRA